MIDYEKQKIVCEKLGISEEELNKKKEEFPEYTQIRFTKQSTDITGEEYGSLTAIYPCKRQERIDWLCKCKCGNWPSVKRYNLTIGHTKTCGRCGTTKKQALIADEDRYTTDFRWNDLTGREYGKLKVIAKTDHFISDNRIGWLCECKCGRQIEFDSHSLQQGKHTSCGYC